MGIKKDHPEDYARLLRGVQNGLGLRYIPRTIIKRRLGRAGLRGGFDFGAAIDAYVEARVAEALAAAKPKRTKKEAA